MEKVTNVKGGVTSLKEHRDVLNEVRDIKRIISRMNIETTIMVCNAMSLNTCSNRNTLVVVDPVTQEGFTKPLGGRLMEAILYNKNKHTQDSIVDQLDVTQTLGDIARAFNAETKAPFPTKLHVLTEMINMNQRTEVKKRPPLVIVPSKTKKASSDKVIVGARNLATKKPVFTLTPKINCKIKLSSYTQTMGKCRSVKSNRR